MAEGAADQDAADAARVAAGDLDAFEGIVRRWQTRLVNLAWRFCRDRHLAEDMAQEAFVKAFRSVASFRGDAAFSTWLTAIALNTYRSRMRVQGPPAVGVDPARLTTGGPGPLAALVARERDEAVRRAVLSLPARYRDALVLFYFEEQSLIDAARALGIPEGTLKARLHRGRALVARRFGALLDRMPAVGVKTEEA